MRVFKKIMYIVLAFVPILPLLLFAVCNVGNTNGVDIVPFGSFAVLYDEEIPDPDTGESPFESTAIFVEKDTILFHFLSGVIPNSGYIRSFEVTITADNPEVQEGLGLPFGDYFIYLIEDYDDGTTRFITRVGSFYNWFSSVGITPSPYSVFIIAYLCYMLFIHVAFMIFDIIVFVPKKISEILEG